MVEESVSSSSSLRKDVYVWKEPVDGSDDPPLLMKDHFSSLLFGGSVGTTALELLFLLVPTCAVVWVDGDCLNVAGSMPVSELALFFWVVAGVRRVYNAYLEAVYFSFPSYRTQPPKEHRLAGKKQKDLCGRDAEQLEALNYHDRMTMVTQFALHVCLYYALPGQYPGGALAEEEEKPMAWLSKRMFRLILNHYVMSFGMYWAHRSLHEVSFLWTKIHSIHHWAKHPLSRNTYEDHWADNFGNEIVGHVFAQILVPLDRPTWWFSRLFRVLESLEKHSGVSCGYNLAHSAQQWLPFAQMPHHHDWHHEGFKGSNYTFTSIGGLWDCIFGTRRAGRYVANNGRAATIFDCNSDTMKKGGKMGGPHGLWTVKINPLLPLVGLSLAVALKLLHFE